METLDFEEGFVEKLKEISNNNFSLSKFELQRRNYLGTEILLELLSLLGYTKVVEEFKQLDKLHESIRDMGN